jgi:ABC-2 type transport system permease protein
VRNVWLIAQREYLQRVRARTFRIVTAIGFVLVLALAFTPSIMDSLDTVTGGSTIAVVDPGKDISPTLRAALPAELPNGDPRTKIVSVGSREAAERGVEGGEYAGVLIPENQRGTSPSFVYRSPRPGFEAEDLREALGGIVAERRLAEEGLDPGEIAGVLGPPDLNVVATGDAPTGEEYASRFGVVYAFGFVLYLGLIMYGNMVAMGVIAEKSTRITELMTAAVKPTEQMTGKLLGVGLLSLTQFGIWALAGLISLLLGRLRGGEGLELLAVPPATLLLFLFFFALGFLLYASIFAGLGSLLSRVEDAQALMAPFTMLLLTGFILTIIAMGEPDSAVARIGSLIPFFTPMVMFARIELGDPAIWEVILGITALTATTAAAIWTSSKLYKKGVLMYGKGPTLLKAAKLLK